MKKVILLVILLSGVVQHINAQNGGNLVIPAIYDRIEPGTNGMFIVTKDHKQGVIDAKGNTIVPIQYDRVTMGKEGINRDGLIAVMNQRQGLDYSYGLYSKDGEMLVPMDRLASINTDETFGYEGLVEVAVMVRENNGMTKKEGIRLRNGTVLSSYDEMDIKGVGGLIHVKKNKKEGVLNKNGEVIVPIGKYDDVFVKGQGPYIIVRKREMLNGQFRDKVGLLNSNGTVIVPIGMYENCRGRGCDDLIHYYIEIESNHKRGAINDNGTIFIPIGKYDSFLVINKNIALVKLNGKYGIVNNNGRMIVPVGKYNDLKSSYGMLTYSQNGKWGVLDQNGNQTTPAEYDRITPEKYSSGMAIVTKDRKIGVINSEGKIIVPLGDYYAGEICKEIGYLESNEGTMIFNKNGRILAPTGKYDRLKQQYEEIIGYERSYQIPLNPSNDEHGLYIVSSNRKQGVVSLW